MHTINDNITIRNADFRDFPSIAQLHITSIKTGFLSTLGVLFLTKLYSAINNEKGSMILVAEAEKSVIGFIAGTINTKSLYKKILFKNWLQFVIPLLKFLFNLRIYPKIVETIIYGFKKHGQTSHEICEAELLSIAIADSRRGNGIGKRLVEALEKYFKENGINQYKVVTFSEDEQANRFYISCNFSNSCQFVHHDNKMNQYKKNLLT